MNSLIQDLHPYLVINHVSHATDILPLGNPRDWVDTANSAIFFLRIKTTSPNSTFAVCGNVDLLQNPFSHVFIKSLHYNFQQQIKRKHTLGNSIYMHEVQISEQNALIHTGKKLNENNYQTAHNALFSLTLC